MMELLKEVGKIILGVIIALYVKNIIDGLFTVKPK